MATARSREYAETVWHQLHKATGEAEWSHRRARSASGSRVSTRTPASIDGSELCPIAHEQSLGANTGGIVEVRTTSTIVRGKPVTTDGKADAARRRLTLDPHLVQVFTRHRNHQARTDIDITAGTVFTDPPAPPSAHSG